MKAKNLKRSDAADLKNGFTDHVAGTVRCSCSTCRSSIWQRVGNASSIRFHSAGVFGMKRTTFLAFFLSHGAAGAKRSACAL
jgi:hypothetical protein